MNWMPDSGTLWKIGRTGLCLIGSNLAFEYLRDKVKGQNYAVGEAALDSLHTVIDLTLFVNGLIDLPSIPGYVGPGLVQRTT